MNVHQLLQEWGGITVERRKEAVKNLFDLVLADFDDHEELIWDFLENAREIEADDGFGTEGARL